MEPKITWLGHDSFRIESSDGKVIYIDPWKLAPAAPPADLILITHEHFDHLSLEDVQRVRKEDTVIVASAPAARQITGAVRAVRPGDQITVQGFEVRAVPAYNVNKFRSPGQPFHPKEQGYVGFVITVDGLRIYHAGDTDVIPEMRDIEADIALLPVSGTYVMTAEEALEAVRIIQPRVAIPMHYGSIVGSRSDAERFAREASVEVRILEPAE